MRFAGGVGTLMSGSGLDTTLETSHGPNSGKDMLSGKRISMFLCANFLIVCLEAEDHVYIFC